MSQEIRAIHFTNKRGVALEGRLHLPSGEPHAFALFAHSFIGTKESPAAQRICAKLADLGIATMRFDFAGLGDSGGDFAETNFSSNVLDFLAAANVLRQEYQAPRLLMGHSLGGTAVLSAAREVPEARCVVTIGSPFEPAHLQQTIDLDETDFLETDEVERTLLGKTFVFRKSFIEDLKNRRVGRCIESMDKALLILHAPQDDIVGIDNAAKIYSHARHPKSFISLDGANHLLTHLKDAAYVASTIASWARRYLDIDEQAAQEEGAKEGWVLVRGGQRKYTNDVYAHRHHALADEPLSVGGKDLGMSPYQYLLAGLGACTSMTLEMYAARKGWPLEKVEVALKHSRVHAKDCEACEGEEGDVGLIDRVISLHGDLSPEQRERLIEIANKCPVHRTLESPIHVETRVGE